MESLWSFISGALGLEQDSLAVWQMALRAVVVYKLGLVLVRLGEKRFIGKFSAFDVIMGIMIGSIISRAITTPEGFIGTLTAALVLIGMHYGFAVIAFHSDRFGDLVKGNDRTLIVDGEIQWDAMRRGHISEKDLKSALRENAGMDDVGRVKQARLERTGNISAIVEDG
jgi:uncharacterized membrane protein YcaP (DUF421 family)